MLTIIIFFLIIHKELGYFLLFFFFNDTAPPEIYPFPLHDALPISAPDRAERARDPHVHPPADGLMARPWRTSHYVVAAALTAAGLVWATREAWPWRQPLTAPAIVVDAAYSDFSHSLGRRETLSDVLARAGVTGRDYAGFLTAAKALPVRRLRPGLVFERSEEHTSELQSQSNLVCRLLLEKKKKKNKIKLHMK